VGYGPKEKSRVRGKKNKKNTQKKKTEDQLTSAFHEGEESKRDGGVKHLGRGKTGGR